jgi:hypothetical protein
MPLDPQIGGYLDQLRTLGVPSPSEVPLEDARRPYEEGAAGLFGPAGRVASVEDADADGAGGASGTTERESCRRLGLSPPLGRAGRTKRCRNEEVAHAHRCGESRTVQADRSQLAVTITRRPQAWRVASRPDRKRRCG